MADFWLAGRRVSIKSGDCQQETHLEQRAKRPYTENLEPHLSLPSDPRGFDEDFWTNPDNTTRMNKGQEYVPVLPSQHQSSSPSSASSPRGVFSSSSTTNGSIGSLTSYSSVGSVSNSYDSRHESPEVSSATRHSYPVYGQTASYGGYPPQSSQTYSNMMNATQSYGSSHPHHSYLDSHAPHMGPAGHAPSTAPPPYSHYAQPAPVLQPAMSYGAGGHPPQYHYPYGPHVASTQPPHSQYAHQPMLPAMTAPPPPSSQSGPTGPEYPTNHDTTGQVAPAGMRPKVTATLWEDEGTLCFQVEVGGICVARREDNHMINGTKLLNVAGMTRGRRDGILKSEKQRHVVKIGPMHLKGVWIPFERALEFANKEKMTERLYPLFVHNIRALLQTQPPNHTTTRRSDSQQGQQGTQQTAAQNASPQQSRTTATATPSQPATLTHSQTMPATSSHAVHTPIAQTGSNRPGLDRAHTFPTPPTSATSVVNVPHTATSYDWNGPGVSVPSQLQVDNANNPRSMPNTPATTPPDNTLTTMHFNASQPYDSRGVYSAPPAQQQQQHHHHHQQSSYGANAAATYGYVKNDMGPPARAGTSEHTASAKDEVNDHEYTSNNSYAPDRSYSTYNHSAPPPPQASMGSAQADRTLLSNDVKNSPQHNGSGRVTPRSNTMTASQPQWPSSYASSQRGSAHNLSYVVSDNRGGISTAPNGYMPDSTQSSPPFVYQPNGSAQPSHKRVRDVEDEGDPYMRPNSTGTDNDTGLKRRKTTHEDVVGLSSMSNGTMNRPKATPHITAQHR